MQRRHLLRMAPLAGAFALLSPSAWAQESVWDMFARNRVLRDADRDGNTAAAQAAIDTDEPILSYDTANNLQLAIGHYEPFVAAGGWQEVSQHVLGLILGNSRESVISLKRRLMSSGDLTPAERVDDLFDNPLDGAVRRFQARHGLIPSGKVDEPTFFALKVPASARLEQLRLNAQRVAGMAPQLAERYVVVNVPAASIEAVDSGMVAQRHAAVVGRIDRQTPILQSAIHQINFNPFWNVPKSIIRRDLIKYMNEDPQYLAKFRIRIYDGKGNEMQPTDIDWSTDDAVQYAFRQDPGADNSMGNVKINFKNPYDVYLHDTPTKGLFGENARFYSSGCVRVDQVKDLVAWVLRDNGEWDAPAVETVFQTGERLDVAVKKPVSIHTTYITAWANRQGTVSFRDDVYEFDKAGRVTFEA